MPASWRGVFILFSTLLLLNYDWKLHTAKSEGEKIAELSTEPIQSLIIMYSDLLVTVKTVLLNDAGSRQKVYRWLN